MQLVFVDQELVLSETNEKPKLELRRVIYL